MTTTTTTTTTAAAPEMVPAQPPPEPMATGHHKRNGVIVGAVGLGLLVTSGVFLDAASGKDNDEHSLCPNATCHTTGQAIVYDDYRRDARNDRGIAYGVGIGGLAFVGVGAYLFATSHNKEEMHVSIDVGHGNTGVAYIGRF